MWPRTPQEFLSQIGDRDFVLATVVKAEGSTPRETGAQMFIAEDRLYATIGGGALELDAIKCARAMLEAPPGDAWLRRTEVYPLGPALNQCCGGSVRVLLEHVRRSDRAEVFDENNHPKRLLRPLSSGAPPIEVPNKPPAADLPSFLAARAEGVGGEPLLVTAKGDEGEWFLDRAPRSKLILYLYGAGHVGREVVRVFAGMPVEVYWLDETVDRFPEAVPDNVHCMPATPLARLADYAPPEACHVVMTCSHALDLEICHAVLKKNAFRFLGLIGSKTKKRRFQKRLGELGVIENDIARMTCPIGLERVAGKEPAIIAVSLAAQLLSLPLEEPQA